jgi:hypothetical protein
MSLAFRTFPNEPFLSTGLSDWTSDLMEPFQSHWSTTTTPSGILHARADLIECQDCFCVYFGVILLSSSHPILILFCCPLDAPGANHEDIDLSVSNGILDVRINRKTPHDREVGIHHRTERRFAERHRRLRLPTNADGENPQANLCEGVLKITFPKVGESSLVKKIQVMQH